MIATLWLLASPFHSFVPLHATSTATPGQHHTDPAVTAVTSPEDSQRAVLYICAVLCRANRKHSAVQRSRSCVFPSCPDFGSAPRAHADREHRWHHIEHLMFECPCVLGTGGTLAVTLLRDDLLKACCGSDHATAVLLAAFPPDRTLVVAATACLVPFLLDPAAALGRPPPWRMKLQCVCLVAAFLLGVPSAACTRLPPSESVLAGLRRPSVRGCSAYGPVLCLPRRCSLRQLLFCTCPPLCAGALWPMPAWVWHDVRFCFNFFVADIWPFTASQLCTSHHFHLLKMEA